MVGEKFEPRYSCDSCDDLEGYDFKLDLELVEGINGGTHFVEEVGLVLEV